MKALDLQQAAGNLKTTTPSDYFREFSAAHFTPLQKLVPGTWASGGSFSTWLGNDLTKKMWEALRAAREALEDFSCCGQFGEAFDKKVAAAREILLAAEGSDTFWWAGPHHDTPQLKEFVGILREKLKQVYGLIGKAVPEYLEDEFLNVPKIVVDVSSRIPEEPIISIDPSSTNLTIPRIGGKLRSLVVDRETWQASLIEFTREPKGEKIILGGVEQDVLPVIHRTDPLGREVTTVISEYRSKRPQPQVPTMKEQKEKCKFCDPDEVAGPQVMNDLAFAGRNLFAFLDFHEVLIHARHIEFMKDIKRADIEDVGELLNSRIRSIVGQETFKRIIAGWNFGGANKPLSSGASIEHMHMQLGFVANPMLVQPDPTADTAYAYLTELGVDLFDSYYTALKRAKLVIWENKDFVLYAPFAPKFKDQVEIFSRDPAISGFIDSTPGVRSSLYDAMFLAIRGLKELKVPKEPKDESVLVNAGIESFNLNFFQRDLSDNRPGQRFWLELDPRQTLIAFAEIRGLYVVDRKPEDTARFMRLALGSSVNVDVENILMVNPVVD